MREQNPFLGSVLNIADQKILNEKQNRMKLIKMAPKMQPTTTLLLPTISSSQHNSLQKRQPLVGALQNGANRISSAANALYTGIANIGNDRGGSSGGNGSSNNGGGNSNNGGTNSGNNGSPPSGNSNSSGGNTSSGNNNNGGGSNSGGSGSSNNNNNSGGSSSNNSGNNGSSSSNPSSGSGGSSNSSGGSGQSNNNNNGGSNSNGGSTGSNNGGGGNGSTNASSGSNQDEGSAQKSTTNNDANGSTPATPVTLSNGAVVTPIAIVDQSSMTNSNGLITDSASQSIVVVMTNSQGQQITSTLAFDSSIAAVATAITDLPRKNENNSGTDAVQTLNGNSKSGSANVGMIAGPIVAVLFCALGALTLFFCLRRKRRDRNGMGSTSSSYSNSNTSRSLRRFIPSFRSPGFGPIRLPSLPSFNLHSNNPQSPEMTQPFNSVLSRPSSGLLSPLQDGRIKRYSRFANPFGSNDCTQEIGRPNSRMSANGLQILGINDSPKNSQRSVSVPESVYFSPPQSHHPRLNSINDAINSGELAYDDDASSIGHDSQMTHGIGSAGSETAERRSYASTMMFSRAIGHSESHKALSSMVNQDEGHDPFSSPTQSSTKSFEIIQSGNTIDQSPKSFQSSFQANESIMSRDTFGIPPSPSTTFGIPSSPMSEKSESNYGFANPGIPTTVSTQIGTKASLSPFRNLLSRPDVQSFSSFTSIVEEEDEIEKGIPEEIKNDPERKRQLSIFKRD